MRIPSLVLAIAAFFSDGSLSAAEPASSAQITLAASATIGDLVSALQKRCPEPKPCFFVPRGERKPNATPLTISLGSTTVEGSFAIGREGLGEPLHERSILAQNILADEQERMAAMLFYFGSKGAVSLQRAIAFSEHKHPATLVFDALKDEKGVGIIEIPNHTDDVLPAYSDPPRGGAKLTDSDIQAMISVVPKHGAAFKPCFAKMGAIPKGTMSVELEVSPDGKVAWAETIVGTLSKPVSQCVIDVLSRLRFPRLKGKDPALLAMPLLFPQCLSGPARFER